MILSNIMKNAKVSRDYEIEIDLTLDCEDIGISLEDKSIQNILEKKSA